MTVEDNDREIINYEVDGEISPLLPPSRNETDNGGAEMRKILSITPGSASYYQTMTNMCKTCAGTGCLALPFATKQGGLLLHVFGMIGIALWNAKASQTLCDCLNILLAETEDHRRGTRLQDAVHIRCCHKPGRLGTLGPPPGSSKLSTVAFYALGTKGLLVIDTMTVILLMGIIVAYQDAIRSFLQGTPFRSGHDTVDAFVIAMLIAPLTIVPDMGYLTKTSAAGLIVLACTLVVIFMFGLLSYSSDDSVPLHLYPSNGLVGVSNWFGCTVFGFGVVPLTYNFQESMEEPKLLPEVTLLSLLFVAVSYIAAGVGLLLMYPSVESDILSELPGSGFVPTITRLAMIIVVMATAPIIVVPCAELIEGKIAHGANNQGTKIKVRFGICFITVIISVGIPGFVNILTLVGCFSVAFVSFCVPPFLHLILSSTRGSPRNAFAFVKDTVMLVWGLAATGISTVYTLRQLLQR